MNKINIFWKQQVSCAWFRLFPLSHVSQSVTHTGFFETMVDAPQTL